MRFRRIRLRASRLCLFLAGMWVISSGLGLVPGAAAARAGPVRLPGCGSRARQFHVTPDEPPGESSGTGEATSAMAQPLLEGGIPDYFDLDVTSPYAFPEEITFGPGFQIRSKDQRYELQIHYESQIEGRLWSEDDQLPANSGFFLPRQRFFFNGQVTEMVEYELAINRGVNNINLLNAFLNFHFDDRFMIRAGRFFTPLPYDQYAISNYWLLTTERSLFTTNLSLNRQIGAMAWGYLFDKRLDYAAGFFNGSRNSFESRNYGLDFVGYLNVRPFQDSVQLPFAKYLNLGASTAFGRQDQPPVPVTFRVGAGSPDANIPGIATVPFLVLNPDVIERGDRLLGSVHAAYFYRSLSLIGEWQYGYGNYAPSANAASLEVPFDGALPDGRVFSDRGTDRTSDARQAAASARPTHARRGPRLGRLGGRRTCQPVAVGRRGFQRRPGRFEPLVQLGGHHRSWRQLVLERLREVLFSLAERGFRRAGSVSSWRSAAGCPDVLAAQPALFLSPRRSWHETRSGRERGRGGRHGERGCPLVRESALSVFHALPDDRNPPWRGMPPLDPVRMLNENAAGSLVSECISASCRSFVSDAEEGSISRWIVSLRAGDEEAAARLWRRYIERLQRLLRTRIYGAAYDEQDVALSAFHVLCQGLAEGRYPDVADRDDLWRILVTIALQGAGSFRVRDVPETRRVARAGDERVSGLGPDRE